MISEFAPAKVNLALHVIGRRADGYHDLDSIVAFAGIGDRLTVAPAADYSLTAAGPFAADLPPAADNIVGRAFAGLSRLVGGLPPVAIHLDKNLPVAAGLGGGSANAAAALRALVRLNGLTLPGPDLVGLALALGADVPVCLAAHATRLQGIGDRLTPLRHFGLRQVLLVNPGVAVSTAAVFQRLGLAPGQSFASPLDPESPAGWRNDLTDAATGLAPAIADVLVALAACKGAGPVRMSGSGATCFAIFSDTEAAIEAHRHLGQSHPGWWLARTTLG
jgi:4-diphosphocytidyl-2-C-methyl-D-erythritol kinase